MSQNMFQEGLYQVYFRETSDALPQPAATNRGDLQDARIHRWFGTVVNTRLLVTGVVQVLGALACILSTVTYACVSYSCSVTVTTPIWSSLFYIGTGCLAMNVPKNPTKLRVTTLMGLNLFSFLLGFCVLLAYSFNSLHPIALGTSQQRAGSHVAKGSAVAFTVQCLLASVYVLFLSWRGLRRYGSPCTQTYSPLSQGPDDNADPLLDREELFSL